MFSISGIVKVIKETQQITDSFKKKEFVVTDASGNYPQDILFQLTQDRVNLLDDIKEKDVVTATFNIRGREWESPQGDIRYFNSLDVWKIDKNDSGLGSQGSNQSPEAEGLEKKNADDAETLVDEEDDDLPF